MKFTSILFNQAPVDGGGSPGNIETSSNVETQEAISPLSLVESLLGAPEEEKRDPSEEQTTEDQSENSINSEDPALKEGEEKPPEDADKKPSELETLKNQINELQEKLAKAQTPVAAPTETSPLEGVLTQEQLEAKIEEANKILIWAEENSDGATIKNKNGEDVQIDAEAVKSYKIAAQRVLQAAPKREKWVKEHQVTSREAREMYPQIFDTSSAEYQFFQNVVQTMPFITKFPNYHLMIGDAMVGQAIRFKRVEEMNKAKNPSAKTPVTKIAPTPPKTPTVKGPAISPKISQARNNLKEGQVSHSDALALVDGFLN